jgi:CheY-like chemotaxis protein
MSTGDQPEAPFEDVERAGLQALDEGDFETARDQLIEAIAGYEQLGDSRRVNAAGYYLGIALAGMGKLDNAVRIWEDIIEHGWDSPAAFNRLHRYYSRRGERDRAEALFRRLNRAAVERTGEFFATYGNEGGDATDRTIPGDALDTGRSRILVADDEPSILALFSRALESEPCNVLMAHDGYEALRMLVTTRVDLIFLDIFMPGYSGLDVLYRVRGEGIETPIIVMSGRRSDKVDDAELLDAEFLPKPFGPDEVVRRVRSVIPGE